MRYQTILVPLVVLGSLAIVPAQSASNAKHLLVGHETASSARAQNSKHVLVGSFGDGAIYKVKLPSSTSL